MISDKIAILKDIVSEQKISVDYGPNTKSYRVPMAAFFLDIAYDPLDDESDDEMSVYIDCEYTMQLGIMFVKCQVVDGNDNSVIQPMFIPLDSKKQNKTQREMMALINLCSKRVIDQEMSRDKYAITSAINSTMTGKQYN